MKFNKRINNVMNRLCISYEIYDNPPRDNWPRRIYAEMEYHTDAHNYDFVFTIELGSDPKRINEVLPDAVYDFLHDFDAEEEMMPWIESRGKNGAPGSIRDILRDGDECEEMLARLLKELNR